MKNYKHLTLIPIVLAAMSIVPVAYAQSKQPPPNSAGNSPNSATDADGHARVVQACSAAVGELKASRILIEALDVENASLRSRLETEKRLTATLGELNETRKSETESLRIAITAKNETLAARDAVIERQDKLIGTLKAKRPSIWRRVGDILIGAGAAVILK